MRQAARPRSSVLFINRVFPPAPGATGEMLNELASELVRQGWDATVLTSRYPGTAAVSETEDGVRIVRVPDLTFPGTSTLSRALSYLSLYPHLLFRLLRLKRHDVLVTKTDPPLQLVLGPIAARLRGTRVVVHWAQDMYPEIAEELGVIRPNGRVSRWLRRVSSWAMRRCARVVVIGRCMRERVLEDRGVAEEALALIPNWPPDTVRQISHGANPFRQRHGLEGKFVVMYSGNMGLAHPFEAVMDAAERLRERRPNVVFLFVGDGPRLPWLEEQVAARGLENVRFLPFEPKETLAESLSAADIHLVSMLEGTEGLVVPSKAYGVLAAGRPCFFLGPRSSEVARIIDEHQCGEVFPAGRTTALADRILVWESDPDRLRETGLRAQSAVVEARSRAVRSFAAVLSGQKTAEEEQLHPRPTPVRYPGGDGADVRGIPVPRPSRPSPSTAAARMAAEASPAGPR